MRITLKFSVLALSLVGALALSACDQKSQENHIKVGISAGIDQQMWETIKKTAKDKYNLDVEVVTFNDFV